MFELTKVELENWRCQIGTSNSVLKGLRYSPYAFTELGVAMLSSVLGSELAVQVNIQIMRAFVSLRQMIAVNPEYELLRETVRRIESDMKIDNKIMSGKLSQLSQKVNELSGLFDQFQESYVVIRRPEDGALGG